MRVLMISGDPKVFDGTSGARGKMRAYAEGLEKLSIIVPVKAPRPYIADGNIEFIPSSAGRITRFLKAFSVATKAQKPDLVTAQDPAEHGLIGWLASVHFKVPLELQLHTDLFSAEAQKHSLGNRIRVVMAHFLLGRASVVRVVSERIRQSIKTSLPDLKADIVVIPVAMDVSGYGPSAPVEPKEVLVVSRLESEKNVDCVIDAFKKVRQKRDDVRLVIVGDGSLRDSLTSQASSVENAVSFEGWRNDVARYYERASVFVQMSSYEGYGCSLMEAATVGVPIVTTDVGVVGYELASESVVVVPRRNSDELAMALIKQLDTPMSPVKPEVLSLKESAVRIQEVWKRQR